MMRYLLARGGAWLPPQLQLWNWPQDQRGGGRLGGRGGGLLSLPQTPLLPLSQWEQPPRARVSVEEGAASLGGGLLRQRGGETAPTAGCPCPTHQERQQTEESPGQEGGESSPDSEGATLCWLPGGQLVDTNFTPGVTRSRPTLKGHW